MAISLADLNNSTIMKPPRILMHGVAGVGKTSFAAGAPSPVFIQTEEGLDSVVDVPHFPLAKTFDDVMGAIYALYQEEHSFETLAVDSIDWLEPLVWAETCRREGWRSLEDIGYGKGYLAADTVWGEYIEGINALRNDRGMAIVQIAHTDIKRFDSPETEPYDRYVIKLHKRASERLQEHADMILFANWKVSVQKTDAGFNKKVARGVGSGQRVMYTEERPAFIAKNRYSLPPELPLSYGALIDAMAAARQPANASATTVPESKPKGRGRGASSDTAAK